MIKCKILNSDRYLPKVLQDLINHNHCGSVRYVSNAHKDYNVNFKKDVSIQTRIRKIRIFNKSALPLRIPSRNWQRFKRGTYRRLDFSIC